MAKKSNGGDKPRGNANQSAGKRKKITATSSKSGRSPYYDSSAQQKKMGGVTTNEARQMGTGRLVTAPAQRSSANTGVNKELNPNKGRYGKASVPSKHTDPRKNIGEVQVSKVYAKARKKK